MDPCNTKIPRMLDLTGGDIAANIFTVNSQSPDKRLHCLIQVTGAQVWQEVMEQLSEVNQPNISLSVPVNGSCPYEKY